jgi:hypothetical protein
MESGRVGRPTSRKKKHERIKSGQSAKGVNGVVPLCLNFFVYRETRLPTPGTGGQVPIDEKTSQIKCMIEAFFID